MHPRPPARLLLALVAARSARGRGRAAALHGDRDDEAEAPRRPAALAGRRAGGLRPHRDRPRGRRRATPTSGSCRRGRRAAAAHRRTPLPTRARASAPTGRTLAFLSTRDGSSQVWALDLAGGEARKLTSLATGVDAFEWLGAGRLALVSEVFPDCGADDACNAKKLAEAGKPSSARVYDELLYRHWDTWDDGRRSHVLSLPLERRGARRPHARRRRRAALQPRRRGLGRGAGRQRGVRVAQGREGRGLAHERRSLPGPAAGGGAEDLRLARLRQRLPLQPRRPLPRVPHAAARGLRGRPVAARGATTARAARSARSRTAFDRQVDPMVFSADSKTLYFTAEDGGLSPVFSVPVAGGAVATVLAGRARSGTWASRRDGKTLVATQRRSPTPRRWCASGGREGPRARDARQRRAPRGLRAACRRERRATRAPPARASRPGWCGRPASIPRRSTRCWCWSTAGRRAPGPTAGASAGTRRSSRARATWSSCPTRAARPAGARSSRTTSTATGAARRSRT